MGHPRRYFEHNAVYFITNRLAEGLPFVPNDYINYIIKGIIATAQARYPSIILCDIQFMQNHYHMLLVLEGDARDLKLFMNFFDGELAKVVTKLLGKRNVKVWAQRYCASRLLDSEAVIKQIVYMYLNPTSANMVASIDHWKGVSTWQFYSANPEIERYKYIRPSKLMKLPNSSFNPKLVKILMQSIEEHQVAGQPFKAFPLHWKKCFPDTARATDAELKSRIISQIRDEETYLYKKRKKPISDWKTLAAQNPYKYYKPKKFGRRVFCISSIPELRLQFIELYKEFCAICENIWLKWKKGDYSLNYPPGAFLPAKPYHANVVFGFP